MSGELVCECGHEPGRHHGRQRACRGRDTYGARCDCPGYVEMPEYDDDDPAQPRDATITGGHVADVIAAGTGRVRPARVAYDPMG